MAENSNIEWTTHTFNPWRGCTKVSAGCANCYAETLSGRNPKTLGVWGPMGTRVVASEAQWRLPVKWNREAVEAGVRARVFCASLADVFEDWTGPMTNARGERLFFPNNSWQDRRPWIPESDCGGDEKPITMNDVRARLFRLIADTPNLDWLILTKRPENATTAVPFLSGAALGSRSKDGLPIEHLVTGGPYLPNIWLGTSVENQAAADERIPHLLRVPAAVRFLSAEPLLGPVEFSMVNGRSDAVEQLGRKALSGIDWVIVGGESGSGARPCRVEWVRSLVAQCKAAGVACFVKQLGTAPEMAGSDGERFDWPCGYEVTQTDPRDPATTITRLTLRDKKGGDMAEFPADLRIRQFPEA